MRGKPPNTIRPTRLEIYIPEDLRAQLELHLYSETEKKVPHGAYKILICDLLRQFFAGNRRKLEAITSTEAEVLEWAVDKAECWIGGCDPEDYAELQSRVSLCKQILRRLVSKGLELSKS